MAFPIRNTVTVKALRFVPYLQANKLFCHRFRVRGQRPRTSSLTTQPSLGFIFHWFPELLKSSGAVHSDPGGFWLCRSHSCRAPSLGIPRLLRGVLSDRPTLCPGRIHSIYYPGQDTHLPSAPGDTGSAFPGCVLC